MKFLIILIIVFLFNSTLLHSHIVSYDEQNYYISTNNFNLIIDRVNGMIKSAKLQNINFEIVTDKSNYSLMFPEFYPEDPTIDLHNSQFHYPPIGSNMVLSHIKVNTDNIAILEFDWNTQYIRTKWTYKFVLNRPFFIVDVIREINKSYVYSNAQQCLMFSSEFDDSYIVAYNGELLCTMDNNNPTGYLASSQHSMFSAIDEGLAYIFPMLAWHEDSYNIIGGVICPYVSSNQRKTISYHGGGSTHSHPGYAEGQFNWFGKSDTESIFLKEGLSYHMQLYYYLDQCSISKLMEFNENLINTSLYKLKECINYCAASYGARTSVSENYFSRFPQASSNYICSQELFRSRAFSVPSSQNGLYLRDTHIFNIYVKQNTSGNFYDLTPIYGTEPLFEDAETIQGTDYMIGSISWNVNSLNNVLNYKVFEGSDKVLVSGEVVTSDEVNIKELFVELELSPRVTEVFSIGDSIFDIRCDDEVYEKIGITVYNIQNVEDVTIDDDHIILYFMKNSSDSLYHEGDSFEYSFSLFPHIRYSVYEYDEITPLFSAPVEEYREYFITLPRLRTNKNFGICPDLNVFPYFAEEGSDSLIISFDLFCNKGDFDVEFLVNVTDIKSVLVNNEITQTWDFDQSKKILKLSNYWNDQEYNIKLYNTPIHHVVSDPKLDIYPNPSKNHISILFELPEQRKYKIIVYNLKGQIIKEFHGTACNNSILWNGLDDHKQKICPGVYFVQLKAGEYRSMKKIVILDT